MWSELFKRWMDMMTWWLPQRSDSDASPSDKGTGSATNKPTEARQQPASSSSSGETREPKTAAQGTSGGQASDKASAAQGETKASTASADDLTAIKGIGPSTRDRLNGVGINSFSDLASADAAQLTDQLKAKMVISQKRVQQWIDEARSHTG